MTTSARETLAVNGSGLTAVAMSGGLDSSVVAWLLAQQGDAPLVGLSMLLWDQSEKPRTETSNGGSGRCCGALDLGDARRVAAQVGIPHYTLRMDEDFRRTVVDPFVDDYLAGRTPSPCVRCNTFVKFDALIERAADLGAERLATGHYARILEGREGLELHQASFVDKDQSYYLFELDQRTLERTLFPLGALEKDAVRQMAALAGLAVAGKGESMEVCFVDSGIRDFVEVEASRRGIEDQRLGSPAEIRTSDGELIGRGQPFYRYTVGQRRGLGIGGGKRLYVLSIDPPTNQVTVGERGELAASGLEGRGLHWIGEAPAGESEVTVRIRSRHAGVTARVRPRPDGRALVLFDEPQHGVAPGQAAVFYDGTRVLGGCWIDRSTPVEKTTLVDLGGKVAGHDKVVGEAGGGMPYDCD